MKKLTLLNVIVVILMVGLLAYFSFRVRWETIVSREHWRYVRQMADVLDDAGIRNRVADSGTMLRVDTRYVDEAIIVIQISDAAPPSYYFKFANALDRLPVDAEDRQRRINDAESVIERHIIAMPGILGANVSLSIPGPIRPFERNPEMPRATVQLTTTEDFSPEQGRRVALIVSRNVCWLLLENIMVTDQSLNTIFNGKEDNNEL